MGSLITLFDILMNQKARHNGKRKAGSTARKRLRKLHTSEYENSCFTKKKRKKKKRLFFISKKIQLIQRSYNQQRHPLHLGSEQYKQLPKKKKKKILRKGKGKRRRESANGREKEKKEEKGKEEKGKEEKKKEEKKWRERY